MVALSSSVLLMTLLGSASIRDTDLRSWIDFKEEYQRSYGSATEEYYRAKVFMENFRTIEEHNILYDLGLVSWKMGVNQFTDLTALEFLSYNKLKLSDLNVQFTEVDIPDELELPDEVDWVKEGAVTPVKDQGQCGSCYTFSTTGALEAALFKKTKKLISLSEQNCLDCTFDIKYKNQGCQGGNPYYCFLYAKDFGLMPESIYPYKAKVEECRFSKEKSVVRVTNVLMVKEKDEVALATVVAGIGPVAVAVCAEGFQHYSSGVLDYDCHNIDHAVLVVGYGTENSKPYWLVKNSWGTQWGEQGYIKMTKDKNNQAEVATFALFPSV